MFAQTKHVQNFAVRKIDFGFVADSKRNIDEKKVYIMSA